MHGVHINIVKPRTERFGYEDLRPSYKHHGPSPLIIAGGHSVGVNALSMRGVDVRFAENIGRGYGPALRVKDSQRVDASGFIGESASPGVIADQLIE